jgi:hypothetical protein
MNPKSRLMLPLAISLLSIQVCSAMDQKTADTQPPAQTAVSIPVAVPPKATTPSPAMAASAPVTTSQVKAGKPPVLVDHYTVMPDDTLTYIAAQREVYGDARLWPLLYRANVDQIGPNGLIFPNQVLIVDRSHSPEELKALIDSTQNPWTPAPVAAKAPAPTVAAPAAPVVPIAPATPVGASLPAASAPVQPTSTTPTPAAAAAETPADAATVKPVGAPASAAPKSVPATSRTIKPSDYLNGAREAFAAGDSAWAIYYYSVYLEQKVTDIDVWGELGNVYYLEGEYAEAAKAYFNVANLLIDRGQTARALELIPVIEEGDAGLSAAIYQRLTTVKR